MLELLLALSGVAAMLTAGTLAAAIMRRQRRTHRAIADALGLKNIETLGGDRIEGEFDGLRIHLEALGPGSMRLDGEAGAEPARWRRERVTVLASDLIPREIELRGETWGTRAASRRGRKEIEIGDEAFDAEVCVRGPEVLLHALLDAGTRSLVRDLIARSGRVRGGEIQLESQSDETSLIALIRDGVALARRLVQPQDLAARLCDIVRRDPLPEVRVRTLAILVGHLGARREVRELCRDLIGSADAELRLPAALALGDEGRETLLDLAEHAEGDNRQAARAVEALGRHLSVERALGILNGALRAGHHRVALAAISALGRIGGPQAVARLSTVLAGGEVSLAGGAAGALAVAGGPAAEAALVGALAQDDRGVRVAAAGALGRSGTPAAVAALRRVADDGSVDRELRRVARQAVGAIQSRLAGASPGQVSLAEDDRGQVSLPDEDRAGRVSIASPEAGSHTPPRSRPNEG